MKILLLLISSSLFFSCTEEMETVFNQSTQEELSAEQDKKLVQGSDLIEEVEPKEEQVVCAMIYDPVCARVLDPKCKEGDQCITTEKTFSSECFANIEKAEILYPGVCDEKEEITPISKLPDLKVCAAVYSPVCGLLPGKLKEEKTFGNICELENAGAEFLRYGDCDKESIRL